MIGRGLLYAILGGIGFVVAAALVPPFAHDPDLQLWHANLGGFVSEWWSLGPVGSHLLPIAAAVLGVLHLLLGVLVRAGRMHLLLALPLVIVAAGLMLVDGTLPLLSLRFYLIKLLLFAWLATSTLAWGWSVHGQVRTHTLIVAGILALLYLGSGWLTWPLMLFLLLVVLLYWGIDSLLALRTSPEQAILTVLPWAGTVAVLLAALLLERFSPQLHPATRMLPQTGFLLLLIAPSFAAFGDTIRSEGHLIDVLDRERQTSKKTLAALERRMTAERNESIRALKLEMQRIEDAARAVLQDDTDNADALIEETREAEQVIEAPPAPEWPDVDRGSLEKRLEHLSDSLQRSRYAMSALKETLADILGHVAVEEERLAQPFAEWENSLDELAEEVHLLRSQFDFPERDERPAEIELPGGITVSGLEEETSDTPSAEPKPEPIPAFTEEDLAALDPKLLEGLPVVEEKNQDSTDDGYDEPEPDDLSGEEGDENKPAG
ncbi:hypothetical protein KQI63_11800 [bacterium]|nr:hypothetical protein [bacterium]